MKPIVLLKRYALRIAIKCGYLPRPTKLTIAEVEAFAKHLSEKKNPPPTN